MNIRVLLSFLAIVVAFFIGGVMAYVNNAPVWGYILWGLDVLFVVVSAICYFMSQRKMLNKNNWILTYQKLNKKLPSIPEYLLPLVQKYEKGSPITKSIEIINMSGQFWNNLLPSQKKELQQLVEWLGMNWEDYCEQMRRMIPKDLMLGRTHKPFEQH